MEKRASQLLSGDRGPCDCHRNPHFACRLCCGPELLGLVHVKAAADNLVDHFKTAVIREGRIPGLLQERGVDCLKVRAEEPADQLRKVQRGFPILQSGDNGGLQSVFVQLELPPALAKNELFLLVGRDILRVAQQCVNLRTVLRDAGADIVTVGTLRVHRKRGGVKPALYPGAEVFKHVSVSSVGVSQFGNLLRRGGQTRLCRINGKAQTADSCHFQRRSEMICPTGRIQSCRSLLFRQTAHRNGPNRETGEVRIELSDIDGACQPSAQNQDQKNQNDGQNDHEFFHMYHP